MKEKRPWSDAISGLVITLTADRALADDAVRVIAEHEALEVSERVDRWLPVSLEADDARPVHDWLESLEGVEMVDVVFVSTDADLTESQIDV